MFSLCTDFLFDIMFVCHSPSTSYASQYWSVSLRSRSWTSKSWSCSWSWSSVRKIWIQRCSLPPKICFKGLRKVCGVQKWYGHALYACKTWRLSAATRSVQSSLSVCLSLLDRIDALVVTAILSPFIGRFLSSYQHFQSMKQPFQWYAENCR